MVSKTIQIPADTWYHPGMLPSFQVWPSPHVTVSFSATWNLLSIPEISTKLEWKNLRPGYLFIYTNAQPMCSWEYLLTLLPMRSLHTFWRTYATTRLESLYTVSGTSTFTRTMSNKLFYSLPEIQSLCRHFF